MEKLSQNSNNIKGKKIEFTDFDMIRNLALLKKLGEKLILNTVCTEMSTNIKDYSIQYV